MPLQLCLAPGYSFQSHWAAVYVPATSIQTPRVHRTTNLLREHPSIQFKREIAGLVLVLLRRFPTSCEHAIHHMKLPTEDGARLWTVHIAMATTNPQLSVCVCASIVCTGHARIAVLASLARMALASIQRVRGLQCQQVAA